ncbi:hypothetical protein [Photorhabdus hindustanensis]|uniref:Nucleoside diphosphate kinase-like domain-containing protein n=1 Tax=Photorhabdus hindustanensis TaxID=2918802 RepID=A0A2S8Q854_9GAMM|nr:hypothetical protein [Photorhabdus hindustanensis]PQQ29129.1 hypothetical protein C6H66_02280 [Photorhabdus hindustanensis]
MSEIALMMLKPEFNISDRKKLYPKLINYMRVHNISIIEEFTTNNRYIKEIIFDGIYNNLLKNANLQQKGNEIGSYNFIRYNNVIKLGDDKYALKKRFTCYKPFLSYAKKLFVFSFVPLHLFIIRRSKYSTWEILKKEFQGDAIQSNSNGIGVRSLFRELPWYTPTTNGLHLSASDEEAILEIEFIQNLRDFLDNETINYA